MYEGKKKLGWMCKGMLIDASWSQLVKINNFQDQHEWILINES